MLLGITDADGFAISMIAILGLSFSFVLVIIVGIIRQARRNPEESENPIDDADKREEAQPAGDSSEKEKREPWEQEADWWKKDS